MWRNIMIAPVTFDLVTVTPEMAAQWLSDQVPNRSLSHAGVGKIASDMANGRWRATPQAIMFNAAGALIDGQHRLAAVVLSGVTVDMWVARNVPDEDRDHLDQGTIRQAKDFLQMEGKAHATILQAAARLVISFERAPHLVWNSKAVPISTAEILADVDVDEAHYAAARQARAVMRVVPPRSHAKQSTYAALSVIVARHSRFATEWDTFHDGMITGANLGLGDPRLLLRAPSLSRAFGGGQGSLMGCLRAWNAYVRGEELRMIKISPRYLPLEVE